VGVTSHRIWGEGVIRVEHSNWLHGVKSLRS
jgi:hypothetical protein